jgi:predicted transcriptional regulator YdeE
MNKWQASSSKTNTAGDTAIEYLVASLGMFPPEAKSFLASWVNNRQTFGADVFRSVVDEFATAYASQDNGKKPSVRQIIGRYESRMNNQQQDSERHTGNCEHCENRGWFTIVVGGESAASARPILTTMMPRVPAHQYAASSLVPCLCPIGTRSKLYKVWTEDGGDYNKSLARLRSDYMIQIYDATQFVLDCRAAFLEAKKEKPEPEKHWND